jgi:hypothetical protein
MAFNGVLRKRIQTAVRQLRRDTHANVMVEFGLALPFLVAMVVGSFAVGLNFDRLLTQGQLARNSANMFARGVKFNTTQNMNLLANAATGMNLQIDGTGDTVVYLTLLTKIANDANCVVGGTTVPCGNRGQIVMAQRFIVGNSSIQNSQFGMIDPVNMDSDGNVIRYQHESYARATVPPTLSNAASGIQEGELIYAADVFHTPTLIRFPGIFAPDLIRSWAYY